MSEGTYLSLLHQGEEADEWCREQEYEVKVETMRDRYDANKEAKTGTTIACACCGKSIKKKSYQTQFCSNKGRGNCKDTYWNNVCPKRRERAQLYA